ncbi:hypothetical protein BOVMAS10_17010 [Streptococcus uberis]|nr:hypothetical protein NA32_08095 [Streptococcus hongkongensis]
MNELIAGAVATQFHKTNEKPNRYNKMLLNQLEQAERINLFELELEELKELTLYWKMMNQLVLKS